MNQPTSIVRCPTCGKTIAWNEKAEFRPFCSRRCQLIDLGDWLTEAHRIPGDGDVTGDDD